MLSRILSALKAKTIEVLDQLSALVSGLSPEKYALPLSILQQNSLGKHVRHIVEFFECLLEGIPHGEVNYDLRQRNLRIETEPAYTLDRIAGIQDKISGLQDGIFLLKADFGNGMQEFQTSVFRELAFAMDHCIHHLALIRIGMEQHFPEHKMEVEIGVAFSTLRYLQQQQS